MKLVPRKLGRGARTRSDDDSELYAARASLATRDEELAKARSALHAEREERDALELALESERKQRAKLERLLARAGGPERVRRAAAAGGSRAGVRGDGAKRPGAGNRVERTRGGRAAGAGKGAKRTDANRGKRKGGTPARGKAENWQAATTLAAEGFSQREIARRLDLNRRTVARLVAADELPRYRRRPAGSMLDPLEPVMRAILDERPGIGAPGMTEVLRKHGYRGSVDLVRRRLRALRSAS
jgi:Homeodomain-like domain